MVSHFGICYCVSSAYRCKAIYMLMWARYTVFFVCFERIYCNVAPISTSTTGCRDREGFTFEVYKGRDLFCLIYSHLQTAVQGTNVVISSDHL